MSTSVSAKPAPTFRARRLPREIRSLTLFFILAALIPLFTETLLPDISTYVLHVLVLIGVWIICTDSLNLVTGFAGQLALGHAAFVTIGAYAGAILMLNNGVSFWVALLAGGFVSFASGLILGLLALRLRGDYLGMVTLGFGEIIRIFAINWVWLTNGQSGLPGIPRPYLFGWKFSGEIVYYIFILLFVFIAHMAIERMVQSRFGRACLAVRDDEVAAKAMGVQSYIYKVWAFCIACGMAGLVGVFYASWSAMMSPSTFSLNDSLMMSVMETLGGIGSLYGAIPGAVVIGGLPEVLRQFLTGTRIASLRFALMGLLLVVLMVVRPQGLYGMSLTRGYISFSKINNWIQRKILRRKDVAPVEIKGIKFQSAVQDGILREVMHD